MSSMAMANLNHGDLNAKETDDANGGGAKVADHDHGTRHDANHHQTDSQVEQ